MTKKIAQWLSPLLFATFMVPIDDQSQWQVLQYSRVPANKTKFTDKGLIVGVKNSSSPLLYPFHKPIKLKKIVLKAKLIGGTPPRIPASLTQGDKGFDDFPLRLGLVKMGGRRLNWLQRQIAPDWLVTLFNLAPPGVGMDYVQFYSVSSNAKDVGMKRTHPLSDVLKEEVVNSVQPNGDILIEQSFKEPMNVLALWLGLDGDDTQAAYQVHIHEITITEEM